jgi:hypothetical protein
MPGTSHDALCTFMIISRSVLLRMRNVSGKSCRENQHTHLMLIFFSKIVPFVRLCEQYGTARQFKDDNLIHKMRFACRIIKARTHTQNIQLILIAFPLQ